MTRVSVRVALELIAGRMRAPFALRRVRDSQSVALGKHADDAAAALGQALALATNTGEAYALYAAGETSAAAIFEPRST